MGLRWMSQYCSEAPFAIKTDDDTFLNIFEMVRLMKDNVKKSHVCLNLAFAYCLPCTCLSVVYSFCSFIKSAFMCCTVG